MPIQCKTGIKTQIMELQFKYPGLWLVNAYLNNGITTQISLILACGVVFGVKCLSSRVWILMRAYFVCLYKARELHSYEY